MDKFDLLVAFEKFQKRSRKDTVMDKFDLLVAFEKFRRAGISTLNRASILIAVVNRPGIKSTALASVIGNRAVNIQPATRRLVELGLLEIVRLDIPSRGPGRVALTYYPTEAGIDLVNSC